MKYFVCIFVVLITLISQATAEDNENIEPTKFPSLITRVRINGPLYFCGESVELGIREVRERFEKEMLLTLWDRPQVALWIKRSTRYMPIIEKMLQDHGMPQDLKYVAIIESALRPHAGSKKGAIGFWQFLETTGRQYGLVINSEKDERRNIFRSTEAAIAYFKQLYNMFGSWTLAAAAYNMGEQGLQTEILAQKTDSYYRLYIPLETQRYVFRIISAKLILSDPETYGFRFAKDDLYPPIRFDRIKVACFQETPIAIIAQAAKTNFKVIKDLNPEIRGHFLAPGSHWILIPEGSANGFQTQLKDLVSKWVAENQERIYIVKEGDNLSIIAERFNVPLPALIIWNRLEKKKHIYPGDRLVIYIDEVETGIGEQE